jgi:hypothetical protein
VKDLVVGSGIEFSDRGDHELKRRARDLAALRSQTLTRGEASLISARQCTERAHLTSPGERRQARPIGT